LKRFYLSDNEPMTVSPYLRKYFRYPMLEHLVKAGLYQLTAEFVYKSARFVNLRGRSVKEVMMVEPEDVAHLSVIDADGEQLQRLQAFRARDGRFERELYEWCLAQGVSYSDVERSLKYTSGRKLLRYLTETYNKDGGEHYARPKTVLSDFNDYLRCGEEVGYNFADEFALFPRDLQAAHNTAETLRRERRERDEKARQKAAGGKIRALYKKLMKRFGFERDGFSIIPPKTTKDIIAEAHALHHCVDRYCLSHADGECVILFIRKTEALGEPFCTMEVRGGKIAQTRGRDNKMPAPEVNQFVELWTQEKLNKAANSRAA
jgi:hypothetical protein